MLDMPDCYVTAEVFSGLQHQSQLYTCWDDTHGGSASVQLGNHLHSHHPFWQSPSDTRHSAGKEAHTHRYAGRLQWLGHRAKVLKWRVASANLMRVEDMSVVNSSMGKPAMLTVISLSAATPTGVPVAWAMAASMSSAADQVCNCEDVLYAWKGQVQQQC